MAKDTVQRPPDEFGISKSIGCDIFPSVLGTCWLGDRKGIRPVKKTWCWFVGGDDLTELCTAYSFNCHHHLHHPLLQ